MSNIVPFQDLQGMARAVAASGLFGMKSPEQALALMLVAQAEGQHPATITQDYDIIQGKAARKTHSVLARFQQMGGQVEWHELTDQVADATFAHKAGGKLRMTWTFEQAKKAGLTGKDNWKNYPRAMLRARCIAEGIRAVYPAALGGMMVSEEAQDTAGDQPITVEARVVETKRPEREPYSEEAFAKNFPTWSGLIEAGKKSPADIVALVESKAILSEKQRAAIFDIAPTTIAEPVEG
jgi:hypothetical protein